MSSPKSSILQPLLEAPSVHLYQCQYTYPLAPAIIREVGHYLEKHPANHIPLDKELPHLREAMQETLVEIDRWDSELERLRDIVRQMQERRESLGEIAFRLGGMVKSTIRRLPPELLSRIFFMARDEGNRGRSTCRVPLTLGHVCSQWRALVHSEPGLWCIIDANFCLTDNQEYADRLHGFTSFCLEKSQPKPVNITLTTPQNLYSSGGYLELEYNDDLHRGVLNELLVNSFRWKVANFWLHPRDEEQFALRKMDFPILEKLDVCFRQGGWHSCDNRTAFSAPRLSRMHLRDVDYGYFRLVNLDALTELTIESYHIGGFLHILQHAHNLCNIKLMGSWCSCEEVSDLSITSRVKSFEVELDVDRFEGELFQHLTLPSLTMLRVSGSDWSDVIHPWQLCQLLSRSRPPITNLVLSTALLSHNGIMDTLALLPTITHLKLEGGFRMWDMEAMESFLRRMTAESEESTKDILVPNLMDLDLHFETQVEGQIGDIMDMLESRRLVTHGLGQRLTVLRLTLWNASKSEKTLVWQRIKALRDNGLDVQARFCSNWTYPELV